MLQTHNIPIKKDNRKIDMLEPRNAKCVLLAMLGFDYRYIRKQTGLCNYQIRYRLDIAKVKLKDYRSGSNVAAKAIEAEAMHRFGTFLAKQLSDKGKHRVICLGDKLLLQ